MIEPTLELTPREVSDSPIPAQVPRLAGDRVETPIVPKATIAAQALIAVVAIMTFLASMTTGAVMLVYAAANDWQAEVSRELTIQIRPVSGRDIEADIGKAAGIARALPGIAEVRPYSKEESARLLEPWLGSGLELNELPVPRIVVVRIAQGATPDLAQLRRSLTTEVPPTSLDDHRGFVDRMRAMAAAAVAGGICVLGLVLVVTVLSVTFATRAAMATNRPVIEVLHFVGAKDSFISRHFQRHFMWLGLKGGLLGGAAGILLLGIIEIINNLFPASAAVDQFASLFGQFSLGLAGYVAVLAQVLLIAVVTALTSRSTVNRTLEAIS
jgi:cell division transport system permease protein